MQSVRYNQRDRVAVNAAGFRYWFFVSQSDLPGAFPPHGVARTLPRRDTCQTIPPVIVPGSTRTLLMLATALYPNWTVSKEHLKFISSLLFVIAIKLACVRSSARTYLRCFETDDQKTCMYNNILTSTLYITTFEIILIIELGERRSLQNSSQGPHHYTIQQSKLKCNILTYKPNIAYKPKAYLSNF